MVAAATVELFQQFTAATDRARLNAHRHTMSKSPRFQRMTLTPWSHIDCIEVDDDAVKAELWEIAENLHRLDLTKDQRDEHIRRYAELLTLQQPQTAVLESKRADGRGHQPKGVARAKSLTRRG